MTWMSLITHLKLHKHVDDKISKAYFFLGIGLIKRNVNFLSKDAFITLYINNKITFRICGWSLVSAIQCRIYKIEKVQLNASN